MSCRFCGAEFRADWGYQCGSGPGRNQRTEDCHEREMARFRILVSVLESELAECVPESELAEWRDYAEGLEGVGNEMKDGATTPDQIAWDRQLKRRPKS